MTKKLPVLESLRVASPCSADWEEMRGDDRVRFCARCEKSVYDVSAMTRAEAEALVAEREGQRLCLRLYRREDGTVITSDCPVGAQRKRLRARVWASLSGAVASALVFAGLASRAGADASVPEGKRG